MISDRGRSTRLPRVRLLSRVQPKLNLDAELLRSLRREIGAPSRPASSRAGADGNIGGGTRGGGGAYGGDGRGGPGPSRRMVGNSGGINDLSSMRGTLLLLSYRSATAEEDVAVISTGSHLVGSCAAAWKYSACVLWL